ncbi:hypothetical protein [Streptomyces sp. NPDC056061]|uniref:hypothetical protein n=1 Tax=Streptomyces sp. NPDC056061 TaxID=3345700 RepID=UPI0035E00CCC
MTEAPHPPPLPDRWRTTSSGLAYAPQEPADLRRERRRAVLLLLVATLLAVAGALACVVAVAQWGQGHIELRGRTGATSAHPPVAVLVGGLVLLASAGLGVAGARVVGRPRKPAVELTPDVVRSHWSGSVEVPWHDVIGVRTPNGPHLLLARPVNAYRVAGRHRREDDTTLLRLHAPAGDLLPLVEWLLVHPEARATVLAPTEGTRPAGRGRTDP